MIRDKVQEILKSRGRSQIDLANALNVTRQTLHYYLTGNITLSTLEEIAAALDVEPAELLRTGADQLIQAPRATQDHAPGIVCPYCGQIIRIEAAKTE